MTALTFTFVVLAMSAVAGFLGALTGLGGGVVIVPALALALGVDIKYAIGASLVSVIATSSGAAAAYVREGYSNIRGPVAQVHAGHAGLNLARCGKAEQEARQRGTCAVVVFRFRGEAGSELIVAAALHQRPHGPDHPLATRAELQAVAPLLPAQRFASLNGGVPLIHGRGLPGVSERRIAFHIEVGRSPAFLSAEVGPGDSQRVHDVVNSVILRPVRHSQAGNADRSRIHDGGRDHLGPD